MIKIKEYGVYDLKEDEQCIYIGTMSEISRFLNYSKDTLRSYLSRKKHDRSLLINHRYEIVEVKEEEEENKLLLNGKVGVDLSYDDYIPVQKVNDKIERYEYMIAETIHGEIQKYTPGEILLKIDTLKELLEDK